MKVQMNDVYLFETSDDKVTGIGISGGEKDNKWVCPVCLVQQVRVPQDAMPLVREGKILRFSNHETYEDAYMICKANLKKAVALGTLGLDNYHLEDYPDDYEIVLIETDDFDSGYYTFVNIIY